MQREFSVKGTSAFERKDVEYDYVIAMTQQAKESLGVGSHAVIKRLFKSGNEWRTMLAFGKVVVDDELEEGTVAIDQTLRIAMGLSLNNEPNAVVRIAPLELSLKDRFFSVFRPGQYLYLRVSHASNNDMEKRNCRVSEDAIKLLGTDEGKSVWVETCVSPYRKEMRWLANEVIEGRARSFVADESRIDALFPAAPMPEGLYQIGEIADKKDADYLKALCRLYLSEGLDADLRAACKTNLDSIVSWGEWEDEGSYELESEYITAYAFDPVAEETINGIQTEDGRRGLLETRYPDARAAFSLPLDLDTIRLDKYYRDVLSLFPSDAVKVKQRWLEKLREDIIDYGLVFVLTVLAAVAAVTPENIGLLRIGFPISVFFTLMLVFFRTK